METVGIAGTGKMGSAIAQRLMEQGADVTVWNRTPGRLKPLLEAGAAEAATRAELVSKADVVITILTDARALDAVYGGDDGLLSDAAGGKLFIEMSTVQPQTEKDLARRVADAGAEFVECPVGGTTGPARQGKLIGFAGGAADAVGRAMPVLEQLCRRVEHVGPVGAGASMKLAINLPLIVYWQAFGEALALSRDLGIEPERMVDIFADTSGGPNVLKSRAAAVAEAISGKSVDGTFDIDSMRKDLRTMLAEAQALGADLPVAERALACLDEGAEHGLGGSDGAMQSVYWKTRTQ